jgi:hypothetical protein
MDNKTFFDKRNFQFRQALLQSLPPVDPEIPSLWKAMQQALTPVQPLGFALYITVLNESLTGFQEKDLPAELLTAACAVEMMHAGNQILIQIPELTKQNPVPSLKSSIHQGAIPLLAADSIHTYAFEWIAHNLPNKKGFEMITLLAQSAGWKGSLSDEDTSNTVSHTLPLAHFSGVITAQTAGVAETTRASINILSEQIGIYLGTSRKADFLPQIKTAVEKAAFLPHRGVALFYSYLDYLAER